MLLVLIITIAGCTDAQFSSTQAHVSVARTVREIQHDKSLSGAWL